VILTMIVMSRLMMNFSRENLSTDFTHEPNEVVPAKAQAGWEESSSLISKKRQMTSFMLLYCKEIFEKGSGCVHRWVPGKVSKAKS
jgi:hypothetical protein